MPTTIPIGWVKTTLGAIVGPRRDRAVPANFQDMRYVGLEHIEPTKMKLSGYDKAGSVRSTSFRFFPGDVLYGRMRPYLNKVWLAEFEGLCSAEFIVFAKTNLLNSEFLAARLNADDFVAFANERASGDRPRVALSQLSQFELLLPPLAEQGRIMSKVSAALTQLTKGEALILRGRRRVEKYKKALIDAAVTGELSDTWRRQSDQSAQILLEELLADRLSKWQESRFSTATGVRGSVGENKRKRPYKHPKAPEEVTGIKLPQTWTWASIDQLAWASGYGTSIKCTYEAEGPPVVRIPNVRDRHLDLADIKYATQSTLAESSYVQPGDMLLIRTNGSKHLLGRAAVVHKELDRNYAFASYLIRYRLVGDIRLWAWLSIAWDSSVARSLIERRAKTTAGQYNLSLRNLADIPIPLPPVEEQTFILEQVDRKLLAADSLVERLDQQLSRSDVARAALLDAAFSGELVEQDSEEPPASEILAHIRQQGVARDFGSAKPRNEAKETTMAEPRRIPLTEAWSRIGKATDARRLFDEAGFEPDEVETYFEALRDSPEVLRAFEDARVKRESTPIAQDWWDDEEVPASGRFRLVSLRLLEFKNLRNFDMNFDPEHGTSIILGWNGTGKSNLFEALVVIFRDLTDWKERNRWSGDGVGGFRLVYELGDHVYKIDWQPKDMKRPSIARSEKEKKSEGAFEVIPRGELGLPRFVFGYYAGPTNRLADHFMPMKQAHYDRLREASADDASTLATLLEKRRFFCAETHHSKYVLLAFSYRDDPDISAFLLERMRIAGFESALFVVRKPRWAKTRSRAKDFWGATGIMRRVMERLREHSIAPMVLEQKVNYGYRTTTEDHYYFFLPDIESLQSFAAEYEDARSFFLALESTDFSELIYDVKIQVRIQSGEAEEVPITFRQLSEGEQQLLMVLGLMRFTQSRQSLVLLDEPDTYLNPHWSVSYLKDLERVMGSKAVDAGTRQSSQILMATHDPLVISSLVKEQVHLLVRDTRSGECASMVSSVDPKGMGFSGILMSELFGFQSDLDEETLNALDRRVRLVGKERSLTRSEEEELEVIDERLEGLGFMTAFSDPYYSAFVRAWGRMYEQGITARSPLEEGEQEEVDRIAQELLNQTMQELAESREE